MTILIVGAGWNGCHIACKLAEFGHQVVLIESGPQIFNGTSGSFGIRLHRGPHYPRSRETRQNCQASFDRFISSYPNLVVDHEFSIYANGTSDCYRLPSKVSDEVFHDVCMEYANCRKLDVATIGYTRVSCAYDLDEPSVAIGSRARSYFEKKLRSSGVMVILNARVIHIEQMARRYLGWPTMATTFEWTHSFVKGIERPGFITIWSHSVINCTGFQEFIPNHVRIPGSLVHFDYTYQVCLALKYRDTMPTSTKPFSFICMDGWFPCIMPAISDDAGGPQTGYILTHGAYTILGSFDTADEARHILGHVLTDELISRGVREPTESEMCRFWPTFSSRFVYEGWYGTVLAKPKCPSEFRSSIVFEHDGIIHVFPGKISNVFDACDEVQMLLKTRGLSSSLTIDRQGSRLVTDGVFHRSRVELRTVPTLGDRSTSNLQTLEEIGGEACTRRVSVAP